MDNSSYYSRHKDEIKSRSTAWRIANPERRKAIKDTWNKANPEKRYISSKNWAKANLHKVRAYCHNYEARKNGDKLSSNIVNKLLVEQKYQCIYCKTDLHNTKYELDHIMPLALGGLNLDENIQLLCRTCNRRKWATHPEDFNMRAKLVCKNFGWDSGQF